MLVVAPCLLPPYIAFRGAGKKELASTLGGLIGGEGGLSLLPLS